MFGEMVDIMDSRYSFRDAFTYTASLPSGTTLAPSGATTLTFNIDGESDFFWDKGTVYADTANDGTTYTNEVLPGVLVTVTDTNSQRPLMNNPTPISSFFGTGRLPLILPIRKLFLSKATVKIAVQNITDNATYTRLDISFIGIKAYLRGNS
jgi:hypothetical protein